MTTTDIDRDLLADTAHRILVGDLVSRGNVLSDMHTAALRTLVGTMADYAAKADQTRKAVALPTGMGKTSAIVAFILAVEELGYVVPLAVATSKVEGLCVLKKELIARGVPEELIGLKHSLGQAASLPSTGDEDRRYMLVTHTRVSNPRQYTLFGQHEGHTRALMIWDETLLRSEAVCVDVRTLKAASAALGAYSSGGRPELAAAIGYLAECLLPIDQAMASLKERGDPQARGADLDLSERLSAELETYGRVVTSSGLARPYVDIIKSFFEVSQEPLRVLPVGPAEGLIWSRECIPELLRNVLVLDASYPIRALVQLDDSITEVPTFDAPALKRFDDVQVVQFLAAGGRSSITKSTREKRQERDAVVQEVVDVVKAHWETSRGILVFTFKQNSKADPDHFRDLKAALRSEGLDPETKVDTGDRDSQGKPIHKAKLQGLTYGMETSLNGFEFCDVVILAGVLHRSELDIAAAMKGQMGNLSAPTPYQKVQEVVQSEVAHTVYQALSRGSCRRMTNGKALPMTAYLIHRSKGLKTTLDEVMPGARWEFRSPTHLKPANAEDASADAAAAILEYLRGKQEGADKVSCREVSKALGTADTSAAKQAFTRGGRLLETYGSAWVKDGAFFVRAAARYGFQDRSSTPSYVDSP